ncbi:MAG: ABC transporter permease, partial [Gemmatimonadaceae bacterium]
MTARRSVERELDDELQFHVDHETELLISRGHEPAEARRLALASLGGLESTKEAYREGRGDRWITELLGDARYALRTLRRSPVLTGAAIVTLALGIGASVAIFSVVNAVILRPLPYPAPNELVRLWENNPDRGWYKNIVAPANMLDWQEQVHAFRDVGAYADFQSSLTLTGFGEPKLMSILYVTGNFLSILGVRPASGRTLQEAESWQTGNRVVVISHRAWRNQLGGASDVVGRSIELNGQLHQIVGVMPEGFASPIADAEAWIPMAWDPASRGQISFRRAHYMVPIARLRSGTTLGQADAELQVVVKRLQQQYPQTNTHMGAGLGDLHESIVGNTRTPLLVLLVATGLLLLIACANVGNLMLVRAAGREREIVLRRALGAGVMRIVRQQLTESLVLSFLGGAVGLLLGWWGTRALLAMQPAGLLPVDGVSPDVRVFLFAVLVTAASGTLFGVAPALWSGSRQPSDVLKEDSRGASAGARARRWERTLVVAEVAIAVLLTMGASLLTRSYGALIRQDPGFDPTGVVSVRLALPDVRYDSPAKIISFFDGLVRRTARIPGVTSAAVTTALPLTRTGWTSDFAIAGRAPDENAREVTHRDVSPDYFRTMRVPLVAGRFFSDADVAAGEAVTLINKALADRFFRGANPIGQLIAFDKVPDSTSVWRRIVGVVGGERQSSLAVEPQIEIFVPHAQSAGSAMALVVRGAGDAATLSAPVRRAIVEIDPTLAPDKLLTLNEVRAESLARERFLAVLLLVFASVGVMLAIVGVYGVISQLALQRTREMGIRIALGAPAARVRWLIVRNGVVLMSSGVALGIAVSLGVTRLMETLLFQIAPRDAMT